MTSSRHRRRRSHVTTAHADSSKDLPVCANVATTPASALHRTGGTLPLASSSSDLLVSRIGRYTPTSRCMRLEEVEKLPPAHFSSSSDLLVCAEGSCMTSSPHRRRRSHVTTAHADSSKDLPVCADVATTPASALHTRRKSPACQQFLGPAGK